jgi:hypothetical protein
LRFFCDAVLLEVLSEAFSCDLVDEDVQSHEGIHLRFFEVSQLFLKLVHVKKAYVIRLVALKGFYFKFRLCKFH